MSKLPLALYAGSLFLLVFVVAPTLLRERQNKNLAGRFYGRILWRCYPLAFLYDDLKRVFFRKLSIFSTLVFSLNFFLSLYLLLMS